MTTTLPAAAPARRRRLPRPLLIILLVLWFLVLMIPCFCAVLAINQEFVIPTGSLPDQHVRIWLIMEAQSRGIGISSGSVASQEDLRVCVTTSNSFVMWAGRGEAVSFCECFERDAQSDPWSLASVDSMACP
jgi:hypothetical protein